MTSLFTSWLMSKDMEMSCDESVMKNNDSDIRESYSKSLFSLSAKQSGLLSPLAFGESNVKSRIKNVLNYKRPTFWISSVVLIAVIVLAVSLISNAVNRDVPTIYIHTENGQSAEAIIGSYGWDFGYKKEQADSPTPTNFRYAPENTIAVYKGQQLILSNQRLNKDKRFPFTLAEISYWDADMSESNLNPDSFTFHNGDLYINAPEEIEEYIFGLHLNYERGNVIYGFKVTVINEVPMKGLELYVWKNKEVTGNNDIYYTLMLGTNRNKVESEIYDLNSAVNSIDKLNEMLVKYNVETELFIYQMNTSDFTNAEMQAISDNLKFPNGNGSKVIGLWQKTTTSEETVSDELSSKINENLEMIMSSPRTSSNPQNYINAHQAEYESILKSGEEALNYLLLQFETGDNDNLRGQIMMGLCKEILGDRNNISDESLSPQAWFNSLSIRKESELPDFVYDGNDPIEKLVYDTEVAQNSNFKRGGFIIIASKIFESYEEGKKLKVFVTTYSSTYRLYDKVLSEVSGSVVPATIIYTKNVDGSYFLDEYKQAMDGSEFAKSIKGYCTMPVSAKKIDGLADKILDHYGNYDDIIILERENLIKHLKANHQTGIKLNSRTGETIPLT